METVSKNIAELYIAGKNVTDEVSPYISRIAYADKLEGESDDISIVLEDTGKLWQSSWYPSLGDTLTVKMGYSGNMLDCGLFEIDETELEISPDTINIKAMAAGITKELRSKNSKAFEKQTLRQIASQIAAKHNLTLTGTTDELDKIEFDRKTQDNQTDIAFLSSLAKEYGIIFSVRGDQLVFLTPEQLEIAPVVATLSRGDVNKARFVDKTSHVYADAVVSKRDIKTNSVKKWSATPSGENESKDTLKVSAGHTENEAQARIKAEAALRAKNREKITGSISVPGNPDLVAGVNIELIDMGNFSGSWHIVSSTHSISVDNGYTTDINIRKIRE